MRVANTAEFMADQARIQNNVGTLNGRSRPLLDNDTQELLARADARTRANILRKMETELGAKLDVSVGGLKLTAAQVSKAVMIFMMLLLLLLVSLLMMLLKDLEI